jgi:hypothetical protein
MHPLTFCLVFGSFLQKTISTIFMARMVMKHAYFDSPLNDLEIAFLIEKKSSTGSSDIVI